MTAWGDGWVLMTYLQWRSLDGLARPSENSCEIRRNNRRGVVEVEGGRRGSCSWGFAFVWQGLSGESTPLSPQPPPPQHPRESGRERERGGVIGSLQPQTRLVPEYQMWQRTRKVSCLCFVKCAMTKCWGAPHPATMTSSPHHTPKHTHTHTGTAHTCRWTSLEGPACLTCSSWFHKYKDSSTQSQINGIWGFGVLTCTVGVHTA